MRSSILVVNPNESRDKLEDLLSQLALLRAQYCRNIGWRPLPSWRFAFLDVEEMRDGRIQSPGNFVKATSGHSTCAVLVFLQLLKDYIQSTRELLLTQADSLSLAPNAFTNSRVKITVRHAQIRCLKSQ